MIKKIQILALITFFSTPASAENLPQFAFPLACTLGENCWVANYVDVDPAPGSHKDFKCNGKTYDDHKGTDFALRNHADMKAGVDVLAARDGKVLRVRDGEDDRLKTAAEYAAITEANKDCGNGVIIDHDNGLLTYYCHLKNSSIIVEPGQNIQEGEKIAQIGQSGNAEFPHLHLTVIWEGGHIDPFTGMLKEQGCGKFKDNLWKDDIEYAPYAIFDGGFSSKVPDFKAIEAGTWTSPAPNPASEAFVFWSSFYQLREGDQITLTIKDSNGKIWASRTTTQNQNRARQHYYTGRKLKNRSLSPGTYTGITTIETSGYPPKTKEYTIEIQ